MSVSRGHGSGKRESDTVRTEEGWQAWQRLLSLMAGAFTKPSMILFSDLITAWVLLPGRHTITRLWLSMGEPRRAHDAYHRFVREGRWQPRMLWRLLAREMVQLFCGMGDLFLDLDDTLFRKTGRKISGAGSFRDAVRSTRNRVVFAWGLNLVVLTLRVQPPWGGEPLGLPINLRLHRKKGDKSLLDLAEEMVHEVASWFPERTLRLSADGFYAPLAGRNLPNTYLTSRMRRDAALYDPPAPRRKGQRGRPAKKGPRLPVLSQIAAQAPKWLQANVDIRGKAQPYLLYSRPVLWYNVCRDHLVLLVIVRDASGIQPDDYFFTDDLDGLAAAVASQYAGRWSIEDTFRSTKQFLGTEDPQTRVGDGPERAAVLGLWTYSAVWTWYVSFHGTERTWPTLPWYSRKTTPSFIDALAALRRVLWLHRIFATSDPAPHLEKIPTVLLEALATAA